MQLIDAGLGTDNHAVELDDVKLTHPNIEEILNDEKWIDDATLVLFVKRETEKQNTLLKRTTIHMTFYLISMFVNVKIFCVIKSFL